MALPAAWHPVCDELPDYFIAYDICDRDFQSAQEVQETCDGLGLTCNRGLAFGRAPEDLLAVARERSLFGSGPREGMYCRIEENGTRVGRAKLVRPGYQTTHRQGVENEARSTTLVVFKKCSTGPATDDPGCPRLSATD